MQIHSTQSSSALTNAQVCRQDTDEILWRSGCLCQIQTPLAFPEVSESDPIGVSIPKSPKTLHQAPALQHLNILTEHTRKTHVLPGKSVWNVFHKLYLCGLLWHA